jgi:hypothetical protein
VNTIIAGIRERIGPIAGIGERIAGDAELVKDLGSLRDALVDESAESYEASAALMRQASPAGPKAPATSTRSANPKLEIPAEEFRCLVRIALHAEDVYHAADATERESCRRFLGRALATYREFQAAEDRAMESKLIDWGLRTDPRELARWADDGGQVA